MRLLIISNRLKYTIDHNFKFKDSAWWLATWLSSYIESLKNSLDIEECLWIWRPWRSVEIEKQDEIKKKSLNEYKSYPIFVENDLMEKFYSWFCNKTLYPIFLSFPAYASFIEENYESYKIVNELFFDNIKDFLKDDDIVWIQDYHFMLLPKLLRKFNKNLKIGYFLHTPFPNYDIFRALPQNWASDIINWLLWNDLLWFHTYEYAQNFLHTVSRIFWINNKLGEIIYENRLIKTDTFPMWIDYNKYYNFASKLKSIEKSKDIKQVFKDKKIILSVDRLDYVKWIINRIEWYEHFLKNNTHWKKKVVLINIISPSRIDVDNYKNLKVEIDQAIGRINWTYWTIDWTPIIYQYRNVDFKELVPLYNSSDICLITTLRDWMNLVSKEYIASKIDWKWMLIISNMAWSSKELNEAIVINPNNIKDVSLSIKEAIELSEDIKIEKMKVMSERIKSYDVTKWANEFIYELLNTSTKRKSNIPKKIAWFYLDKFYDWFKKSNKKALFLDYDWTLVPFYNYYLDAIPDEDLIILLNQLSNIRDLDIYIVSWRDKNFLEKYLWDLNINLIAEHWWIIRPIWWKWEYLENIDIDWKIKINKILTTYIGRLPESYIEEKEYSIAWHYRNCDDKLWYIVSQELINDLTEFTSNSNIQIVSDEKTIEIRTNSINKWAIIDQIIQKNMYDFIVGIWDSITDEDMFDIISNKGKGYSIKIWEWNSIAKYKLLDYKDVRNFLGNINNI